MGKKDKKKLEIKSVDEKKDDSKKARDLEFKSSGVKRKKQLERPEEVEPEIYFKKKSGKMKNRPYLEVLNSLQIELVKLQNWVKANDKKVMIVFEGRDTAGKGGVIKRITEHLNPRGTRVVALGKPSDVEKGQWYFQRYVSHLPNPGEIVLFDRSWYNRAGVERVMGFCDKEEYSDFLYQAPNLEQMWLSSGFIIFKFFLEITQDEQIRRLDSRKVDPLKRWKLSPVDKLAIDKWDNYTEAFEKMLSRTHTPYTPWIVVKADDKKRARINIIRDILGHIDYDGKDEENVCLLSDPEIVSIYSHVRFSRY
jgi:polyphosphate kinase 2